jgi:Spy/CpxP family protein refolding chaperone
MRRLLFVLLVGLATAGCAGDSTAPAADEVEARLDELALLGYGSMEAGEPGNPLLHRLSRLPPDLALSAAQRAAIAAAIDAFMAATADDRLALGAIMRQAAEARQAGATPEEVRAILAGGAEIRMRLIEAERALHQTVLGVLTPAQRAWLHDRPPPHPCGSLTEAQRNEISALFAAFEQAHAADLALIRAVHDEARAAHHTGATREEVMAILEQARPAMQRVAQARAELMRAVRDVLTPAQRAAGCLR